MITDTLNDTDWTALDQQRRALGGAAAHFTALAEQTGDPAHTDTASALSDLSRWLGTLQDDAANYGYPVVFSGLT